MAVGKSQQELEDVVELDRVQVVTILDRALPTRRHTDLTVGLAPVGVSQHFVCRSSFRSIVPAVCGCVAVARLVL